MLVLVAMDVARSLRCQKELSAASIARRGLQVLWSYATQVQDVGRGASAPWAKGSPSAGVGTLWRKRMTRVTAPRLKEFVYPSTGWGGLGFHRYFPEHHLWEGFQYLLHFPGENVLLFLLRSPLGTFRLQHPGHPQI